MEFAVMIRRVCAVLFADAARPVEIISGFNMLAWAAMLFTYPAIVDRDTYVGFRALGPDLWAFFLLMAGTYQLLSVLSAYEVFSRMVAMSAASGVWTMIAINFLSGDVHTTADANYIILALMCAISGAFLGWKKL